MFEFDPFAGMRANLSGIGTMANLGDNVANQFAIRNINPIGSASLRNLQGDALGSGTALSLEAMRQSNQNQRINALLPAILAAFSRARQSPQLGQFTGQQNA